MELIHQVSAQLKQLRLSGVVETLEARQRQAIDGPWSYVEFLSRLLEDEIERRAQKQLAQRLRRSNVQSATTLEGFDFSFNPSINRQQILALASGDYLRQHRNVLICGPSGVGKSHLAQALGHEACRQGYDVVFVTTHKLLQHLNGGRADGSYARRLDSYLRPDLLILDDFGLRLVVPPRPGGSLRNHCRALRAREHCADEQSGTVGMAGSIWQSAVGECRAGSAGAPCGERGDHGPEFPGRPGEPRQ